MGGSKWDKNIFIRSIFGRVRSNGNFLFGKYLWQTGVEWLWLWMYGELARVLRRWALCDGERAFDGVTDVLDRLTDRKKKEEREKVLFSKPNICIFIWISPSPPICTRKFSAGQRRSYPSTHQRSGNDHSKYLSAAARSMQ